MTPESRDEVAQPNRDAQVDGGDRGESENMLPPQEEEKDDEIVAAPSRFQRALQWMSGETDEENLEAEPVPFRALFRYATTRDKVYILIGVLCAIASGALAPLLSFLHGSVANIYVETKDPIHNDKFWHAVFHYIFLYLALGTAIAILTFIQSFLHHRTTGRVVERMRAEFVKAVLAQDAHWLDATTAGTLSNQLNDNIERIREGLGDKLGLFTSSAATYVGSVAIAFAVEWRIALIMLWVGPASAISTAVMPMFSAKSLKATMGISEEANSVAEEAILNVKTVASLNAQQSILKKYSNILRRAMRPQLKVGFVTGFFEGVYFLSQSIFYIAGFWYGITAYHNGVVKHAGDTLIIVEVMMFSSYIMGTLGPHIMAIIKARVAAAIVYKTIDRIPNGREQKESLLDPTAARFDISFKSVEFGYPGRPAVLRGLNWHVSEGETVALVGRSGCGKSTSIGLITRLYDATAGDIQLGGKDIRQYDVASLRKMIGIVSQEPALFNGTVAENIKLGRESIADSAIEECAKIANAHEFIMALEKGYETLLGAGGATLSGGQKQRVAIARAIAANPRLLLLDEATSALDTQSERIVQEALQRASAGRTTVVIAHRLSTIKNANRIYVIEEGAVAEEGGYSELCARPDGKFAAMVAMQNMEEVPEEEDDEDDLPEKIFDRQISSRSSEHQQHLGSAPMLGEPLTLERKEGGVRSLITYSKWRYAIMIGVSFLRGLDFPVTCFAQFFIFRSMLKEDYQESLTTALVMEACTVIYAWITMIASKMTSAWSSERILADIRAECLSSLLHRPAAYFDRTESSPAASSVMLSQSAPGSAAPLDYRAATMFENVFAGLVLMVVCSFFCWQSGITAVLSATTFCAIFAFLNWLMQKQSLKVEAVDTTGEMALEIFEKTRTIQLLSVEPFFTDRFQVVQAHADTLAFKVCVLRAILSSVSDSFTSFMTCVAQAVGVTLVFKGLYDVNIVFFTEMCIIFVGYAVYTMTISFNDLLTATTSARQLFSLIDPNHPDIHLGSTPALTGAVAMKKVRFAYPTRPKHPASNGLTFSLQEGKSLALVGPSGGGKSTVIALLERFYDLQGGEIEMDGHILSSISLHHLRRNVALVGQEPVLFCGTIIENICMGIEDEISFDEAREACRTADAADFIEALPEGYDTSVGDAGRLLSGGQRQRIALARAIARKPRLLLLDEATSALDSHSEQIVRSALEASSIGRTTIHIAHRLASIEHVDKICVVEGGRVVESGDHESLLRRGGKYAGLVAQQRLS